VRYKEREKKFEISKEEAKSTTPFMKRYNKRYVAREKEVET
jgi:hypothetical protein